MPADILLNSLIASQSVSALKSSLPPLQAPRNIVSEVSTTSVTGKVTTVTTFSDGSSSTTISDGDVVILSTEKSAR